MSALAIATVPADRETDDLDLVAAVRAGDDRAFETLFLRYRPLIAGYVGGRVRDHGRVEDITQEVFMSALRRLREDDVRQIHFRPWIYEIAKNKCIDAYRRGCHVNEVSFDAHDEVGAAEHVRLAEPRATPDTAVEAKDDFHNLRGAFGGLPQVQHDILVMREFEGLSYRDIGDRLGMSRASVESTLFRARKRLGEEYEELVSGKRCLRVQRIVEDADVRAAGLRAAGLRDQRRVARHLAHCQPCRRYAHLAGVDLGRRTIGARIAAFLPLPAFLRRGSGGGDDVGHLLSQHATRPVAQWTAHIAGAVDPGTMSTWAKVAVTAAAVAIAGGTTIEHRATGGAAAPPAASAPSAAGVENERRAAGNGTGSGSPGATTAAAQPDAAAGGSTAGATAEPAGPPTGSGADPSKTNAKRGGVAAQRTPGGLPQAPPEPAEGAPHIPVAPVVDAVGGATPRAPAGASSSDDADALVPGRRLAPVVAPAPAVAADAGRGVQNGDPGNAAPGNVDAPGAAPLPDVGGSTRDTLRDRGTVASDAAPTAHADSVLPRVSDASTNPIATPKSLGA